MHAFRVGGKEAVLASDRVLHSSREGKAYMPANRLEMLQTTRHQLGRSISFVKLRFSKLYIAYNTGHTGDDSPNNL